MINGAHVVLYSKDAEADRNFFRDVLRFSSVDAGHGWLIFGLPKETNSVSAIRRGSCTLATRGIRLASPRIRLNDGVARWVLLCHQEVHLLTIGSQATKKSVQAGGEPIRNRCLGFPMGTARLRSAPPTFSWFSSATYGILRTQKPH